MKVRIERLDELHSIHIHSLGDTPEEEAYKKLIDLVAKKGLSEKVGRLFGRNTYPTNNPEPHGYELFLTIDQNVKLEDKDVGVVPGGLYAVLRFTDLNKIREA